MGHVSNEEECKSIMRLALQDTANAIVATLANTLGAATCHDKRLFLKVVVVLYLLSALGRASGAAGAYPGLCLFCLYIVAQSSSSVAACASQLLRKMDSASATQDTL